MRCPMTAPCMAEEQRRCRWLRSPSQIFMPFRRYLLIGRLNGMLRPVVCPNTWRFFKMPGNCSIRSKKGHNARQYPCRSSPAGVKSVIKLPACCFGRSAAGRQGSHRAKNKRLTQFCSFTLFKPALGGSFVGADFARGSCEAPRGLHLPACFCLPKDV